MVMLLPPVSRMDRSLADSADDGSSKIEVFLKITLPILRKPIFQTGLLMFLLVYGRICHLSTTWPSFGLMFSVLLLISCSFNVPFAVALALCLY